MDDQQKRMDLVRRMRDEGIDEEVIETILEAANQGRAVVDPETGMVQIIECTGSCGFAMADYLVITDGELEADGTTRVYPVCRQCLHGFLQTILYDPALEHPSARVARLDFGVEPGWLLAGRGPGPGEEAPGT